MSGFHDRPRVSLERLGAEAFHGRRLNRSGTWAVAFLADWCPFCRRFVPEFAALAGHGFGIAVADVTSDQSPLWEQFGIEVIPTVIVFRNGTATFRADGRYMEGLDSQDLDAISGAAAPR
jgi:thioredoxin 1